MAKFDRPKLTRLGEALMQKCLKDAVPFKPTRIAIGDGYIPEGQSPYDLTALISEKYSEAKINKTVIGAQVVQFEIIMDATKVTEGFWLRELGIYAEDPDDGEILYVYDNAGDFADYIPVTRLAIYMRRAIRIMTQVADAANVQLTVITETGQLTVENIGEESVGAGVYARRSVDGAVLLKRLVAGDGVDITEDGDTIRISII